MAKDYKRTNAYKELKNSLIKQLEDKNNANDYFMDLVEDYMRLYVIKNQLNDDIEERGVSVKYNNGGGQYGFKRNDSITDFLKVNAQMLKILLQLEIKATPIENNDNDDDEL